MRHASLFLAVGLFFSGAPAGAVTASDPLDPFEGRPITAIEIEGHHVTRDGVIRREIRSAAGRPLHVQELLEDVQRLDNLSIFAQILVRGEPDGQGVRVIFHLKEMPAWIPLLGFSYTEQDGFSGGPKLSALNLGGRAISLNAQAYFGGANQFSARLAWPWIGGNHVSLDFYGALLSRTDTLNDFKENSYELTPEVGTWLGDHGRLEGKVSLFRMQSDVDGKTLSPDNDDHFFRVGVALGWDNRDSWRFPVQGWQNELELWRTQGDGDFWSLNLDVRRWIPITKRQRLMVTALATLQSGTVDEDVPIYLTYRMGGANSIRGYSIEDLGRRLFGKNQLLGTVEYSVNVVPLRRWDIWKFALRLGIDLAVFSDIGIAWSEPEDLAAHRARAGLGAGVRLLVPGTEMVRFDMGWSEEGGFQFHFASGTKPVMQRRRIR
jgi:outer membrane protein insertion porin family